MIEWQFILNPDTDNLEIDEPVGWAEFEQSLLRDDKVHGMTFEASIGSLRFYGDAADFLREQKILYGLKSNVIFQALIKCNEEEEFEEVIKGRLNYGRYKEDCGTNCFISMPIEEDSCAVIFKNRYDQKVDIDKPLAFDELTVLADYAAMGFPIDLPAKDLLVSAEGYVAEAGDPLTLEDFPNEGPILVRPIYLRERYNSIKTGQIGEVFSSYEIDVLNGGPVISPQLLYEDNPICFSGEFEYEIRLKGNYVFEYLDGSGNLLIELQFKEYKPEELTDITGSDDTGTVIENLVILPLSSDMTTHSDSYDITWTGTIEVRDGYGYYAFLRIGTIPNIINLTNTFDPETYIRISNNKSCPVTREADAYLIHETLSRTVEAITNSCMRVKSEYYGRTDSQPFAFDVDGCGGLRMFTSGLKLRLAPEDKFFASAKDLIEGLMPIDNIGFGIEADDTLDGKYVLRVEDVGYFYQDVELLRFDFIPSGIMEIEEQKHYATIQVGYNNWEPSGLNGLDEIHSTREYRTSLDSISTILDIKSNLIAGSYIYEITRQQSFAASGGADTKYDNNIFILCLVRSGYVYSSFEVEQGNITSPANIYSPDTVLNYRLSPVRNLMRWFRSIINSYANFTDTDNKLYFAAGTGNLIAEGLQTDLVCRMENQVIAENQNISIAHFLADYEPIWRNELTTFEYPLSIRDYRIIKANPYGYISFQCGSGDYEKGYIKEVKYKPAEGKANFVLRKKYEIPL